LAEEIGRVRELIAGRHSKSALQLTKDIYKRCLGCELARQPDCMPAENLRFATHDGCDIEETSSVPEETVVEVYRNGYEWNGEVYRTAQVKVARNPERKSE
jgi:hypothetical protein